MRGENGEDFGERALAAAGTEGGRLGERFRLAVDFEQFTAAIAFVFVDGHGFLRSGYLRAATEGRPYNYFIT